MQVIENNDKQRRKFIRIGFLFILSKFEMKSTLSENKTKKKLISINKFVYLSSIHKTKKHIITNNNTLNMKNEIT
jgi:hypothetical protein